LSDSVENWHDDRAWLGEFFDDLSLGKSLYYGPKIHFLWKFLKSKFCQLAELSIWTLCGLVIYETWSFNRYKKLDGTSSGSGDMGSLTGQHTFCYLRKNSLYSLDFVNINSHKITKKSNPITFQIHILAGSLIGGFIHSQIQNFKTA
jgi:hypothetical protein